MQQWTTDVTCNCISNVFNNDQKYFLAKKKQFEENESPIISRRGNKSSEVKNQSAGKQQKKSLKKRPNSNISSDVQIFTHQLNEVSKMNNQLKTALEGQPISHPQGFKNARVNEGYYQYNRQPQQTAQYNRGVQLNNKGNPVIYSNLTPMNSMPREVSAHNQPYGNLQTTFFYDQQQIPLVSKPLGGKNHFRMHEYERKIQTNAFFQMKQQPHITHKSSNQNQKRNQILTHDNQETESWLPGQNKEDSFEIQGFDQAFKDKEHHQSHAVLCYQQSTKNHLNARDAQRSKRLSKQNFGRFVQSEDENRSQSPPSQVIGKDFDNHYQDFQQDQSFHREKTLATRSTNTKLSQFKGNDFPVDFFQNKFGSVNHFKSYKNL